MWAGVLGYGLGGLLLLVLLWPTESSAVKLLRRWRIAEPTSAQVAEAWSYLRRRRFWYPWIFLAAPVVFGRFGAPGGDGHGYQQMVVTALAALLIAELLALRPTRARIRTASLTPRGLFDLVPRWGVTVFAVLIALVVGFATAGIVAQEWAFQFWQTLGPDGSVAIYGGSMTVGNPEELGNGSGSWTILGATGLCLLAVGAVIGLAMIRPASGDPVVDAVLRTRSARVALGRGIGLAGPLLNAGVWRIGLLAQYDHQPTVPPVPGWIPELYRGTGWVPLAALLGCVLAWIWVANPPAKLPLVAR